MNNFIEFLSNQGVEGAMELELFLNEFKKDPTLFFKLTAKERTDVESKMDIAFLLLQKG